MYRKPYKQSVRKGVEPLLCLYFWKPLQMVEHHNLEFKDKELYKEVEFF